MITINSNNNPAAGGVPGLFVNVQAPPAPPLSGVPADIIGAVGTASWGPIGAPLAFSDEQSGARAFAPMVARKYDLMTQVHACVLQGARNFRGVRVSDGSDTAASVVVQTTGVTLTGKYTGIFGALIQYKIATGTANATWKITLTAPGYAPEIFDNIPGTLNAAWVNIAAAINNGVANGRGPSELVVATAGASTSSPTAGTGSLAGGADGAAIAVSDLLGSDNYPRKGIYALRNTGAAFVLPADCDTPTAWPTVQAFALSECAEAVCCSVAGDTISNFGTTMNAQGVDNPWVKVLFGDWIYMQDGVNGLVRLVSPQGFYAGRKAVLGPANSALNQPLNGVAGTQKSGTNTIYSYAELQLIGQARGDVIVMNSSGGNYPSCAFGRNSSSDAGRHQDSYTTMTNYLARSLDQASGLGRFIGRNITVAQMREAQSSIGSFLQVEADAGRLGNPDGTIPYSVQLDRSNNPQAQTSQGIEYAKVMAQYQSVLEYFLVDLTGGQTVQIQSQQQAA